MKKIKAIVAIMLGFSLLVVTSVQADENLIRESINKAMPAFKIDSIQPSEMKGLYEVLSGAKIYYVSSNGQYLFQDDHLIDIKARKDLTEPKLVNIRVKKLKDMGEDQMIIFKPKESKYTVSIFTDIDCGYCRKLHKEMDQYLAEGITVQYMFYPRAGKGSSAYKKAVSVWCADDRNAALTKAKNGATLEPKDCDHPIDKHMELATDFEVRGTPMIVTENGTVLPGYVPASRLAKVLANH